MNIKRGIIMLVIFGAGCGPTGIDNGLDGESDSPEKTMEVQAASIPTGSTATVTASSLNLRSGPSTSYDILTVMSMGDTVDILGYQSGWYNVSYQGTTGWCSGLYLKDAGGGSSGGGSSGGGTTSSGPVADAIARAQSGVGFSYHWGAGCWDPSGTSYGACYGSCPNCSHSGTWGADCSGYVAKVWQVPSASAVTSCSHPYSTTDFYSSHDHWSDVSRSDVKQGDAFVYHSGGEGHIFLYDSGDAWGWVKAYEAKGCSYGIIHDTRQASSIYKAIRREGF